MIHNRRDLHRNFLCPWYTGDLFKLYFSFRHFLFLTLIIPNDVVSPQTRTHMRKVVLCHVLISVPYLSFRKPLCRPSSLSWPRMFSYAHLISSFAGQQTPLQLLPSLTPTPPTPTPRLFFTTGAIPAHLFVTFSANEGRVHGGQAPMRGLFHLYKTFQDSLPGCTFCQSRAPRGEQQPREREREGVEREQVWTQGGCQFLIPIPHFKKVVGEHGFNCFLTFSIRPAGPLRLIWVCLLCFLSPFVLKPLRFSEDGERTHQRVRGCPVLLWRHWRNRPLTWSGQQEPEQVWLQRWGEKKEMEDGWMDGWMQEWSWMELWRVERRRSNEWSWWEKAQGRPGQYIWI